MGNDNFYEPPPQIGTTTKSFCDCSNKETGWGIASTRIYSIKGINVYSYAWVCLNCGKRREVGRWDENGKKVI